MKRRSFMTVLAGAVAYPLLAGAQQKTIPVIGQLSNVSPPANLGDLLRGPIHQGMGEMGFVEGQKWPGNTAGPISIMIGARVGR